MQLLSTGVVSALLVGLSVVAVVALAADASAHPPERSGHGVNETTYHKLWSGDVDATNASHLQKLVESNASATEILAAGTDIPFSKPPQAVERWNSANIEAFPDTDNHTVVHPPGAHLSQGPVVKDAFVDIFASQPSTRTRLSVGNSTHYVASSGELLAVADYRVETPLNDTEGIIQTRWRLLDHRFNDTRLFVDGELDRKQGGSPRPAVNYSLATYPGDTHTLDIAVNVTTTLQRETWFCRSYNNSNCIDWWTWTSVLNGTLTVWDSVDVTEYDLVVSGYHTRYPNSDLGLVVYKNKPWLGYSLPGGEVNGVWRFYTARNPRWDVLYERTQTEAYPIESPVSPLRVYAYPIETGPTAAPADTVDILHVFGEEQTPPRLPDEVNLDVLEDQYIASYGIATRIQSNAGLDDVTAYGLVRGVTATPTERTFIEGTYNQSDLSLTVVETTDETATVRLSLRDAQTHAPIDTSRRNGSVLFAGERIETDASGTVTRTFSRSVGAVSARYEPGLWWHHTPSYVSDSDTVAFSGGPLHFLGILYQLVIPVGLFCLAVFLIDRITGWGVWPFWRRL